MLLNSCCGDSSKSVEQCGSSLPAHKSDSGPRKRLPRGGPLNTICFVLGATETKLQANVQESHMDSSCRAHPVSGS